MNRRICPNFTRLAVAPKRVAALKCQGGDPLPPERQEGVVAPKSKEANPPASLNDSGKTHRPRCTCDPAAPRIKSPAKNTRLCPTAGPESRITLIGPRTP